MALALAAKCRGIVAHIVVPENTPDCKKAAIRGYGANLVLCGDFPQSAPNPGSP